jgi:hypothetical protein
MYAFRDSVRIFIPVTLFIFAVSLVRGVGLGQSITLGACCGVGGTIGGMIGLKFWKSRKMHRNLATGKVGN